MLIYASAPNLFHCLILAGELISKNYGICDDENLARLDNCRAIS